MNKNYNVSFSSNIKIVPKEVFDAFSKGHLIDINPEGKKIYCGDCFYTLGIRTCSAGSLISKKEKSVGFHIFNTNMNNYEAKGIATQILGNLQNPPDNGILIGGKKTPKLSPAEIELKSFLDASMQMFTKLKEFFSDCVKNLTIFEEHKNPKGQTHYFYSKKEDTHYICAESKVHDNVYKAVKSLKQLKSFYNKIKIAKSDKLYIGDKEITREMSPEIFDLETV